MNLRTRQYGAFKKSDVVSEDAERDAWLAECKREMKQEWMEEKRDKARDAARRARRTREEEIEEEEIGDDFYSGAGPKNVVPANVISAAHDFNTVSEIIRLNETDAGWKNMFQAAPERVTALLEKGARTTGQMWLMYERFHDLILIISAHVSLDKEKKVIKMYSDVQEKVVLLRDAVNGALESCEEEDVDEESDGEETDEEAYAGTRVEWEEGVTLAYRSGQWRRV